VAALKDLGALKMVDLETYWFLNNDRTIKVYEEHV